MYTPISVTLLLPPNFFVFELSSKGSLGGISDSCLLGRHILNPDFHSHIFPRTLTGQISPHKSYLCSSKLLPPGSRNCDNLSLPWAGLIPTTCVAAVFSTFPRLQGVKTCTQSHFIMSLPSLVDNTFSDPLLVFISVVCLMQPLFSFHLDQ